MQLDKGAFTRLLDSGLVAQERRGRMTFVGLNSLHPAAGELRSLVLAMNGLHAGGEFLAERRESYGVTHLFTTKPRLNALRGLAEAPGREIDVSALERQFPLRDRAVLRGAFEHFETFGVVRERSARGLRLFSFDESWPHLPSLLALLDRIAQVWPQSKNKAGGVAATHPDDRRDRIPPRS